MNINDYIEKIESNDSNLTTIELPDQQLDDTMIAPLFYALSSNPSIAKNITYIDFSQNKITSFDVTRLGFISLESIYLDGNKLTHVNLQYRHELIDANDESINASDELIKANDKLLNANDNLEIVSITSNPLTDVSIISLKAFESYKKADNENFSLFITNNNQLTDETELTDEMLDAHFKNLLNINHNSMDRYTREFMNTHKLRIEKNKKRESLPLDVISLIMKFENLDEASLAHNSMANLKEIFDLFCDFSNNDQQIKTLESYENGKFKAILGNFEFKRHEILKKIETSVDEKITNREATAEPLVQNNEEEEESKPRSRSRKFSPS